MRSLSLLFISKFQHEHYFDLYFLGIFLRNIFLLNWFHKRIGISITIMWDMLMRWFVPIFLFHVMWFILYVLLVVVILHIHIWWTCFVILPIHCFVILPIHGGYLLILRLLLFFCCVQNNILVVDPTLSWETSDYESKSELCLSIFHGFINIFLSF